MNHSKTIQSTILNNIFCKSNGFLLENGAFFGSINFILAAVTDLWNDRVDNTEW